MEQVSYFIESYGLYIGLSCLIGFMVFIIWDLAKQSKSGRLGTFVLFLVLGLGILGFIIKGVIQWWIDA